MEFLRISLNKAFIFLLLSGSLFADILLPRKEDKLEKYYSKNNDFLIEFFLPKKGTCKANFFYKSISLEKKDTLYINSWCTDLGIQVIPKYIIISENANYIAMITYHTNKCIIVYSRTGKLLFDLSSINIFSETEILEQCFIKNENHYIDEENKMLVLFCSNGQKKFNLVSGKFIDNDDRVAIINHILIKFITQRYSKDYTEILLVLDEIRVTKTRLLKLVELQDNENEIVIKTNSVFFLKLFCNKLFLRNIRYQIELIQFDANYEEILTKTDGTEKEHFAFLFHFFGSLVYPRVEKWKDCLYKFCK